MPSIYTNSMASNAGSIFASHYDKLATSIQRLSSGLRVNSAADDAAGLAIRELMRADVAALNQGARNINDAISLIQTADSALGIIDEKLIRMKELAEQAATGTYASTQRLMIHSEFEAMASEIDRIANATDFNGIKLLDGSLRGEHDGSGLTATGNMKIHFGSANDSAEDYYYLEIGDCTTGGLGLREPLTANANVVVAANNGSQPVGKAVDPYDAPILSDVAQNGNLTLISKPVDFSIYCVGIIPAGTTGLYIDFSDNGANDTIQIFSRDGKHLVGTTLDKWTIKNHITTGIPLPSDFMTEANGFLSNASYDPSLLNGTGTNLVVDVSDPTKFVVQNLPPINGMSIGYTGDGHEGLGTVIDPADAGEILTIDKVTEDLIFIINGYDTCEFQANWTYMPADVTPPGPNPPNPPNPPGPNPAAPQGDIISIKTQQEAQEALTRIDDAIVAKDKVRTHLGAMQNRLENSATNISIQAANLRTAESRISDVDVSSEMLNFVRNQVLTQSATAMLGQANSFPHVLMRLLQA